MATPTQFRHYLISQDADGGNIEIARSSEQVGVLAFDSHRLEFVHCHVLLEALSDRRAFEDRARKLSESGHPLLARVLDFGEDEGSAFYITENVDGETLRALLSRHAEIPIWLAAKLAELSLAAFQALSERGDYVPLQPLDALRVLQTNSRDLRVYLADFRLAETANEITLRNRQSLSAYEKQARFLFDYFTEQVQNSKASPSEFKLSRADFSEVLENLLLSCGPKMPKAIGALRDSLTAFSAAQPAGDLPATFKPRPLIGPLLASFQEVGRSVSQTVRIQSQKLDAGQPYALRGTLMKSGQPIVVEQVPPERLAGIAPGEALKQARNIPKAGKFPNLVPVIFVEGNEGLECVAETVVEGVTLGDLLASRVVLEVQEIFLLLSGVDTALGQLEKASRATRRLRLEDIFLFTGSGKESVLESGLIGIRLHEWSGFSIVLRGHPCLHRMSGRGTDPGLLLPVEPALLNGNESPWHGGWLSALGAILLGTAEISYTAHPSVGVKHIADLLQDELANARRGRPGTRAALLAKMASVMDEHGLNIAKESGFGNEVSGSPALSRERDQQAPRAASSKPTSVPIEEPELVAIGFAEALIHPSLDLEPGQVAEFQNLSMESSWTGFREKKPVWIRVITFAVGAMVVGALLAQMQGRALWQISKTSRTEPADQVPSTTLGTGDVMPPPSKLAPSEKTAFAEKVLDSAQKKTVSSPDTSAARLPKVQFSGAGPSAEWRAETESAAKKGDAKAMIALGHALLRGAGGAVDERGAFNWYEKAVQAGDTAAVVSLAGCYLQGWGTAPDFPQAVNLLKRAASNGDAPAMDLLGVCYSRGLGVARDDAKAFEMVSQAHAEGVPSACGNLGVMYLRGQGVPSDPARAAGLFAEGSKKGHAESMLFFAQSLEKGIGVPVAAAEASHWYQQAARLGNAEAADWCQRNGVGL